MDRSSKYDIWFPLYLAKKDGIIGEESSRSCSTASFFAYHFDVFRFFRTREGDRSTSLFIALGLCLDLLRAKSEGLVPMGIPLGLIPRLMTKGESAGRKVKIEGSREKFPSGVFRRCNLGNDKGILKPSAAHTSSPRQNCGTPLSSAILCQSPTTKLLTVPG
ncbi:hypothetical protein V6N13_023074 [Hibiscus sabdariffa]